MEQKPLFYLGHTFSRRKEIRTWELGIETKHNIKLLNPFYDVPREDVMDKDDGAFYPREKNYKRLVEDDIRLIGKADKLLALISKTITIGTIQELVYARFMKKEILIIIDIPSEKQAGLGMTKNMKTYSQDIKKIKEHPWLRYHSDRIFIGREEFEKDICKRYT